MPIFIYIANMKLLFIKLLCVFMLSQIFVSCHEKLPESKALATEVKKRKIGRIKPLQIVNETKRLGVSIVQQTDSIWWARLKQELALQKDSTQSEACNMVLQRFKNYEVKDVTISKFGNSTIQTNAAIKQEQQLFDAYQYNADHQLILADNVQKVGDSIMLYTQPITFTNEKCRSCHVFDNQSSFAGMWSVRMRKRLIVENIWLNN